MPTLAVIKTGGKQYIVRPGQKLKVEKLERGIGEEVIFDQVLLVSEGQKTSLGFPLVEHALVKAKILAQGKAKKITILKYKPKTRYRKKMGHRQPYTEVEISSIEL